MKKLIIILLALLLPAYSLATEYSVDKEHGYYVDGRGQVIEAHRSPPPNEDRIPEVPNPTKTVLDWDSYYKNNVEGKHDRGIKDPVVPNYNVFYSTRRNKSYDRETYVNVWCSGKADVNKGTCLIGDTLYYFYDVQNWSLAVTGTPFRNIKNRGKAKKYSYVFYVDNIGLDSKYMYEAKDWAELTKIKIHFVTIDSYIPLTDMI